MNSSSSLAARAARHAALADPIRLRIVDLLTASDATPGELREQVGITSNLMAHHLRQLEAAGLITKRRSDADRRRSYVTLAPGSLEDLVPAPRFAARRVVFVCTGNSARSQLAAALWNEAQLNESQRSGTVPVPAASAGTHPADRIAPGAVATANRHGLNLPDVLPRHVGEVLAPDDLIVTVCDSAHEELDGADAIHWSVANPSVDGSDAAFDLAFDVLAERIARLTPTLTPVPEGSPA
ncbi:helix-turn-helix domain-containing protein [Demequina capsici]|uniref:Helix-turn-helix domain-containing protein n=1 Tax=Demequina capsici TaxID=3075620 RepID=A0AA96F7A6_9MICO|nr:helix-turn-helix domain-containing protein [Demequina sp. OYTSA14]WNM24604.1 helix-turn-helix domain-containing protein [Demequina sp. OYTSA14]